MRLIIKFDEKYICSLKNNVIGFIEIPSYNSNSDFYNVDIFTSLLCGQLLNDSYEATKGLTYSEGLEVFGTFDPDAMKFLDSDIALYNLDDALLYFDEDTIKNIYHNLEQLPGNLSSYSYEELLIIEEKNKEKNQETVINEDIPIVYQTLNKQVDSKLLQKLNSLNVTRTEKDVLLLYSGGKDSTLAAIRLKAAGYNVHFIHFDNGAMLDNDKPYLTFTKTFANYPGYYFDYENHAVDIKENFQEYFSKWKQKNGELLTNASIESEIRCLSCRMAMYTEAIKYAKINNFKYLAEGARISQKFMIEQYPMIERLKELTTLYGIELLLPVLTLESDNLEIEELLSNDFSSKGWESKCLIGKTAKDKTEEDEKIILDYYRSSIKPKLIQKLKSNTISRQRN